MKEAGRLGVVDTLCQWHPYPDDECPNVAARWFVERTSTEFIAVCKDCSADFWAHNCDHFREISREEAEVLEVHNA